jgi:hypothetical protein
MLVNYLIHQFQQYSSDAWGAPLRRPQRPGATNGGTRRAASLSVDGHTVAIRRLHVRRKRMSFDIMAFRDPNRFTMVAPRTAECVREVPLYSTWIPSEPWQFKLREGC